MNLLKQRVALLRWEFVIYLALILGHNVERYVTDRGNWTTVPLILLLSFAIVGALFRPAIKQ